MAEVKSNWGKWHLQFLGIGKIRQELPGRVAQEVEHLPVKHQGLSSKPSTVKEQRKTKFTSFWFQSLILSISILIGREILESQLVWCFFRIDYFTPEFTSVCSLNGDTKGHNWMLKSLRKVQRKLTKQNKAFYCKEKTLWECITSKIQSSILSHWEIIGWWIHFTKDYIQLFLSKKYGDAKIWMLPGNWKKMWWNRRNMEFGKR
jgi:hypothetical protein